MVADKNDAIFVGKGSKPEYLALPMANRHGLVAGATGYELVYQAEPGYRLMARQMGAGESGLVRRLEAVDRWTGSPWARRVYRVHGPWAAPSAGDGDAPGAVGRTARGGELRP